MRLTLGHGPLSIPNLPPAWVLVTAAVLVVAGSVAVAIAGPIAFLALLGLLAAIGVLIAGFTRPVWLLWLTLVSVPLLTVQLDVGVQVIMLPEALFYISVAVWLLHAVTHKRLQLRSSPMNLPAALFGALYVISFLRVPDVTLRSNEISGDKLLYDILVGLAMYLVVSNALYSRRDVLLLVSAWPLAGMLAAAIGFHYYFSGERYFDRLISTLGQEQGPYLLYIGALLLGILASPGSRQRTADGGADTGRWLLIKVVLWLCLAVFGLQIFLNGYRGVWLAMGLIFLTYLMWNFRRRWLLGLLLVVVAIALLWLLFNGGFPGGQVQSLPPVLERALNSFSPDDTAAGARMIAWRFAIRLAGESPIIGVGLSGFRNRYMRLALPAEWTMNERGTASHNMYLDVLLEAGLLGLVVLIWLFIAAFMRQRDLLRRTTNDRTLQGIVAGLGFMLASFLIWGFTNSPLHMLFTANLNIFAALGLLNAIHATLMNDEGRRRIERATTARGPSHSPSEGGATP